MKHLACSCHFHTGGKYQTIKFFILRNIKFTAPKMYLVVDVESKNLNTAYTGSEIESSLHDMIYGADE